MVLNRKNGTEIHEKQKDITTIKYSFEIQLTHK
jgi:hypothetical protein